MCQSLSVSSTSSCCVRSSGRAEHLIYCLIVCKPSIVHTGRSPIGVLLCSLIRSHLQFTLSIVLPLDRRQSISTLYMAPTESGVQVVLTHFQTLDCSNSILLLRTTLRYICFVHLYPWPFECSNLWRRWRRLHHQKLSKHCIDSLLFSNLETLSPESEIEKERKRERKR